MKILYKHNRIKNSIVLLPAFLIALLGCQFSETDLKSEEQNVTNSIRWKGNNETANYMALQGLNRYITYENSHSFIMSEAAVNVDSTLFASHVILGFLSKGNQKEHHKRMAQKFVQDENEVSKLFVSLLNYTNDNDSLEMQRRSIWKRMHELTSDPFIHYMYIRYMDVKESEKLAELKSLIDFCTKNNYKYTAVAANSMAAYILKRTGDLKASTKAIEQCLKLNPDGYNSIDSRAEFYLYEGDTLKAIETYKKVLEKYPYAQYAEKQLEKLEKR